MLTEAPAIPRCYLVPSERRFFWSRASSINETTAAEKNTRVQMFARAPMSKNASDIQRAISHIPMRYPLVSGNRVDALHWIHRTCWNPRNVRVATLVVDCPHAGHTNVIVLGVMLGSQGWRDPNRPPHRALRKWKARASPSDGER